MRPKRTIAEWITVARVSGGVRHLFVEGATDARLLQHLSSHPTKTDIRTADEVDCNTDDGNSFFGGHKLRLIKLASESVVASCVSNILCFVDADFRILVESTAPKRNLIFTDYASLPAEAVTEKWLEHHFLKAYGYVLRPHDWNAIVDVLQNGFAARYLSSQLNRPHQAPAISKHCTITKGQLNFDKVSYVCDFFHIKKNASAMSNNSNRAYQKYVPRRYPTYL